MTDPTDLLTRYRALEAQASPGPWSADLYGPGALDVIHDKDRRFVASFSGSSVSDPRMEQNARLAALCRNTYGALLEALCSLEAESLCKVGTMVDHGKVTAIEKSPEDCKRCAALAQVAAALDAPAPGGKIEA